jgi:t-SNARE complex subunit (syntaxin)
MRDQLAEDGANVPDALRKKDGISALSNRRAAGFRRTVCVIDAFIIIIIIVAVVVVVIAAATANIVAAIAEENIRILGCPSKKSFGFFG